MVATSPISAGCLKKFLIEGIKPVYIYIYIKKKLGRISFSLHVQAAKPSETQVEH